MQWNIEEIGPVQRKMTVEIPQETVSQELDRTAGEIRKQARLKGFRKGKVPMGMIKKLFFSQIEQEVKQNLIQEHLPEAMNQITESMASQPTIEDASLTQGEPFRLVLTFEVKPDFTLEGFEQMNLTRERFTIEPEEIEKKLEELRNAYTTSKSLEESRPLAQGDLAVIDYQGFEGDEPLEGAANPNYQIELGSGRFHQDFETGLEGLFKDEEKDITVTFKEDHYNPKLAGKEVRFHVKVMDVKEKVFPELNDDFAKDLGENLETLEDLKNRIKEDLTKGRERTVQHKLEEQVRDNLLELVDFQAPPTLVNHELESMIQNTLFNLKRSGIPMEAVGLTEAKLEEDYRPEAEKRVKVGLILEKIASEKSIEVTDQELNDRIMDIARAMGQTPEVVADIYRKNNMMDSLRGDILSEKTLKSLIEGATIEDIDPPIPSEPEAA